MELLGAVVRVGGAVSALLSADLPWSLFSSPLDFDSITATYQVANGVVHIHDLQYSSWAMQIAASGEYALKTNQLSLQMTVKHGRGEVHATVTGPADSPSVRVTPTAILREIDPEKLWALTRPLR